MKPIAPVSRSLIPCLTASLLVLSAAQGAAQRVKNPIKNGPGAPPDISMKVTRVDFEKREEAIRERDERLAELMLQEQEAADALARDAARIERETLQAQADQIKEQERLAKLANPEDFVANATKAPMTSVSKTSSINETVVTSQAVVAQAQASKVVRRAR